MPHIHGAIVNPFLSDSNLPFKNPLPAHISAFLSNRLLNPEPFLWRNDSSLTWSRPLYSSPSIIYRVQFWSQMKPENFPALTILFGLPCAMRRFNLLL